MQSKFWISLVLGCVCMPVWSQVTQDHIEYVERYKDIAIREMERAGIPASIKLAQAILESDAGRSNLARRSNNHFGIKCGNDWRGETFYQEDDDYDNEGKLIKSCFRSFKTVEASYVAHSEFLRDPSKAFRYGFLFRLDPTDYKGWANGLRTAGYATSATYSERVISLIERYELQKYDRMSTIDIDTPTEIVATGILKNNDVSYVVATGGETVADIARRTDVAVKNLISYNENLNSPEQRLREGDRIYLQPKRNTYRGREKYHIVTLADSMFSISQQYAVNLPGLFRRNRLESGQEPAPNERIKLRGTRVKQAPRLRRPGENVPPPAPPKPTDRLEMEPEPPAPWPTQPPATQPPATQPPQGNTTVRPESPGIIIGSGNNRPPTTTPPSTTPPSPAPGSAPSTPTRPTEDVFGLPTTAPSTPTTPPSISTPTVPQPPAGGAQYHTVAQGDTLWNISRRYNITVDDLRRLNQLEGDAIKLGQQLRVK